ncbi:MAG: hypothetical protein DRO40_10245 [Thermoprotei archaeon]|nr:MAG: hypothetical protein DRO40_10245 [Thermoprotei archaeon]
MQFALAAKLILNMHDLNNERAEEIRRIPLIYEVKDGFKLIEEAVAVSGVMLKHWHATYLIERAKELGISLCPLCERGEAIRVPPADLVTPEWLRTDEEKSKKYIEIISGSEEDIIKSCIGEDVHGFLRTKPSPTLRRESLIKFSWLLPAYLEEVAENVGTSTPFRIIQQSRNIREVPEKPKELAQMQMPYPRAYAGGVYGFVSIVNLEHIGFAFTSRKYVVKDRYKRQRATIEAFIPMITGAFGASLARALPAAKPLELLAIVSKDIKVCFPSPVHPIYEDYFELNKEVFKGFAEAFKTNVSIFTYGVGETKQEGKLNIERVNSPTTAINKALEELGLSGE